MSAIDALKAQRDIELAANPSKTSAKPSAAIEEPPKAKTAAQLIEASKFKRGSALFEQAQTPLLQQDKKPVTGARKMQYGIFKKAAIVDSDDEEDNKKAG